MISKSQEFELLINLSEKQQEFVSGGACTETREPNYTLIECSDTTTETATEEDEAMPSFLPLSMSMAPMSMGPSSMSGFSSLRFPRFLF